MRLIVAADGCALQQKLIVLWQLAKDLDVCSHYSLPSNLDLWGGGGGQRTFQPVAIHCMSLLFQRHPWGFKPPLCIAGTPGEDWDFSPRVSRSPAGYHMALCTCTYKP